MTHRRGMILGVLALALLVVLPTPALASGDVFVVTESAPSGPRLEADEYPATLTGERLEQEDLEGYIDLLKWSGAKVTCSEAALDGGEHEGPATELTLEASYAGCKVGSLDAFVAMNSCQYALGDFSALETWIAAQAKIECEGMDEIEVTVKGGSGGTICTFSIPAQQLESEGSTQLGNVDQFVWAAIPGDGLQYAAVGKSCPLVGITQGNHEDGNSESFYQLAGMYKTDGTSGTSNELAATEYPFSIEGERFEQEGLKGYIDLLRWGNGEVTCSGATLDGGEHEGPVTEVTLEAAYTGCKVGNLNTVVVMNSCRYAFGDFSALDSWIVAQMAIECDGTDEIEIITLAASGSTLCTYTVPPQQLEPNEYAAQLGNFGSVVSATVSGDGVEYTAKGKTCPFVGLSEGAYEDGSTESFYQLHG